MSTTKDTIARWFDEGVKQGATHMVVACDTFDYTDFPVYVDPGKSARKVVKQHQNERKMLKVMEVYDLRQDRDLQVNNTGRVFNYGDEPAPKTVPKTEKDLVPLLRALAGSTADDDPLALDNTSHCPRTMHFTSGSGKSARYVRVDLALEAAEHDVRDAVKAVLERGSR